MLGKYDRIDLVDLVYRDRIYPDTYLLTGGGCYSVVAYIDAKRYAVVSDLTDAFTVSVVRSALDSLSDCIDAFFADRGQVIVNAPNFDSVPAEYKDLYLKMTNLLNNY